MVPPGPGWSMASRGPDAAGCRRTSRMPPDPSRPHPVGAGSDPGSAAGGPGDVQNLNVRSRFAAERWRSARLPPRCAIAQGASGCPLRWHLSFCGCGVLQRIAEQLNILPEDVLARPVGTSVVLSPGALSRRMHSRATRHGASTDATLSQTAVISSTCRLIRAGCGPADPRCPFCEERRRPCRPWGPHLGAER